MAANRRTRLRALLTALLLVAVPTPGSGQAIEEVSVT